MSAAYLEKCCPGRAPALVLGGGQLPPVVGMVAVPLKMTIAKMMLSTIEAGLMMTPARTRPCPRSPVRLICVGAAGPIGSTGARGPG